MIKNYIKYNKVKFICLSLMLVIICSGRLNVKAQTNPGDVAVYKSDGTYVKYYSCSSSSTTCQTVINQALTDVSNLGGGTVFLHGAFTYKTNGVIKIGSNTKLTGDSNAKVQPKDGASWSPNVPIIGNMSTRNDYIEISGFEIYGNETGVVTPGDGYRDESYQCIILNGSNISIHNMYMHNNYGDGILIGYNNSSTNSNISVYDNTIYRIQHDAICVNRGSNVSIHDNIITARLNAGMRLYNTNIIKIYKNNITSDGSGGAGIQIQNGGTTMNDIEIYDNEIYKTSTHGIWVFGSGSYTPSNTNVNIHHNLIYNVDNYGIAFCGFNGIIQNNVIYGSGSTGLYIDDIYSSGNPPGSGYVITAKNNIFSKNGGYGVNRVLTSTHTVTLSYNCFYSNTSGNTRNATMSSSDFVADPKFASTVSGSYDFHLQSPYGRWYNGSFIINTSDVLSTCINAGTGTFENEPVEQGTGARDIGRYGNTAQASKKYPSGNQTPVAVINNITPNPATQGATISFTGTGTDADGSITAYEWSSSINGVFSTSEDPNYSSLSVGTHTISFRVKDNNSTWSSAVTKSLVVNAAPITNLIADWKFNEISGTSASDNSGNVNTGTLVNSPSWVTGKIGNALSFTNSYVNIPSSSSINSITNAITISAWIKTTNTSQEAILERWQYGTGVNKRAFCLEVLSNKVYFGLSKDGTSANSKWLTSVTSVNDGTWKYITATFDGTTMKIYINGVLDASVSAGFTSIFASTGNLHIGKQEYNSGVFGYPFIGTIDEMKLYNKALTLSEVQSLYALTKSSYEEDLTVDEKIINNCFPNPFSSDLNISYTVTDDSDVLIEIYDYTGKVISKVVDEEQVSGNYNITWNSDESLTNGIYFCRIIVNGKATTSKIMLVK
jgi:hypothetical protein